MEDQPPRRPRRRIAELAELRRTTIEIAGERVVLVEPTALINSEYRNLIRDGKRREGLAHLIQHSCEDEDGGQFFDHDEAMTVAGGRAEVWTPIVGTLTAYFKTEKKLSPSPSDSATDSPSPLAEPSPNSNGP